MGSDLRHAVARATEDMRHRAGASSSPGTGGDFELWGRG
jgi:hypothetical protein